MLFENSEAELLVNCLNMHINPNNACEERLKCTLKKRIDWNSFLYLVAVNKVIALVWKSISTTKNSQIPNYVISELGNAYCQLVNHHVAHIQELKRLLILFRKNDIPAIPFKGALLGTYYSRSTLRQWGDLDIIIQKEDILKVVELLKIYGYIPSLHPANLHLKKLLASDHAYHFFREDGLVKIDVHWSLTDADDVVYHPMRRIWKNTSQQLFFDVKVPHMTPEDLLISTCIHHGVRNGWDELRYIADFAILMESHQQLDWIKIIAYADEINIRRSFLVGVALSSLLFEIKVPSKINEYIDKDKNVSLIQYRIYNELFKIHNLKRLYHIHFIKILLRERYFTKIILFINLLKSLFSHVLRPNELDKSFVKLPSKLGFICYLYRPFRLVNKFVLEYYGLKIHRFLKRLKHLNVL